MLRSKEFKLPIYATNIVFIHSTSYKEVVKFCRDSGLEDSVLVELEKGYHGITFSVEDNDENTYHYVIVIKSKDKYEEIGTITHEISHLVSNILSDKDIIYDENNSEPYAYLTGYINKEFFKFKDLTRNNNKNNK